MVLLNIFLSNVFTAFKGIQSFFLFDVEHKGLRFYKIYKNDNPWLTLTYFVKLSNLVYEDKCWKVN